MKLLFTVFILLISFSSVAEECKYLDEGDLVNISLEKSKSVHMSRKHVQIWNKYFDVRLSPLCKKNMLSLEIRDSTNKRFYLHRTHSDECDGGNIYGLIHDRKGRVVIEIQDGWLKCPNETALLP